MSSGKQLEKENPVFQTQKEGMELFEKLNDATQLAKDLLKVLQETKDEIDEVYGASFTCIYAAYRVWLPFGDFTADLVLTYNDLLTATDPLMHNQRLYLREE